MFKLILDTHPGKAEAADGVCQHVPEQGGEGVEGWEVGVHVRRLPVCDLKEKKI